MVCLYLFSCERLFLSVSAVVGMLVCLWLSVAVIDSRRLSLVFRGVLVSVGVVESLLVFERLVWGWHKNVNVCRGCERAVKCL